MIERISVTPPQLFYLGSLMNAKYVDFSYITALGIVDESFKILESEIKADLSSKGFLKENFSGDVELDGNVKVLLSPLFECEKEITIDIVKAGELTAVESYKYHFLKEKISQIYCNDGCFDISHSSFENVVDRIKGILPIGYSAETEISVNKEVLKVDRLIAIKTISLGKYSSVINFIDSDGVIYLEDDKKTTRLSSEDYLNISLSAIQEVKNALS